ALPARPERRWPAPAAAQRAGEGGAPCGAVRELAGGFARRPRVGAPPRRHREGRGRRPHQPCCRCRCRRGGVSRSIPIAAWAAVTPATRGARTTDVRLPWTPVFAGATINILIRQGNS